jgi:hypothetical protein
MQRFVARRVDRERAADLTRGDLPRCDRLHSPLPAATRHAEAADVRYPFRTQVSPVWWPVGKTAPDPSLRVTDVILTDLPAVPGVEPLYLVELSSDL